MGTSGSYGGSQKKDWQAARKIVGDLFGHTPRVEEPRQGPKPQVVQLLRHIGNGLSKDDPLMHQRPVSIPLAEILAVSAALGGLPSVGRLEVSGKQREVLLGARRVGAALGGGLAVRTGNAGSLSELALDLDTLRGLPPNRQVAKILDRVFGASSDEVEYAFRSAAAVILTRLLSASDSEIEYTELICDAATEVIFQRALVELEAQFVAGALSAEEAGEREREIKEYIRDLVRGLLDRLDQVPTPQETADMMARVTQAAIHALSYAEEETLRADSGTSASGESDAVGGSDDHVAVGQD